LSNNDNQQQQSFFQLVSNRFYGQIERLTGLEVFIWLQLMALTSVLQNRLMHLAAGTPSSFEVQLCDMRLQLESQVV
jgi:hypothetical protein